VPDDKIILGNSTSYSLHVLANGLLRDLHDLAVLASEAHLTLTVLMQAAKALRDEALLKFCEHLDEQTRRQQAWLLTQVNQRAAHTLVVPREGWQSSGSTIFA